MVALEAQSCWVRPESSKRFGFILGLRRPGSTSDTSRHHRLQYASSSRDLAQPGHRESRTDESQKRKVIYFAHNKYRESACQIIRDPPVYLTAPVRATSLLATLVLRPVSARSHWRRLHTHSALGSSHMLYRIHTAPKCRSVHAQCNTLMRVDCTLPTRTAH